MVVRKSLWPDSRDFWRAPKWKSKINASHWLRPMSIANLKKIVAMRIYETAVKKPITTILVFIGVIIFGLFSVRYLPIDLYPEIDPPMVTIYTFYQGAGALDIETNITRVLEDQLNTVNNLKKLT